jgi:hypothetical protein
MNGTYKINGALCARFNAEREAKYDLLGRNYTTRFFAKDSNCLLFDNDMVDGVRDYSRSDMRLEIGDEKYFIEVAIKLNIHFGHISQGVDVEWRKLKYFVDPKIHSYVLMFSDLYNQMCIINSRCLSYAQRDCGEEYYGQKGREYSVQTSPNFQMPIHGCHRVRKWCEYKGEWTKEDFFRIPYKYVPHLENKCGWKHINKEECKAPLPKFIARLL